MSVYVENFVNDFSTVLSNSGTPVGANDTQIVVAANPTSGTGAGYPDAVPNFRIRIESELMLVTGYSGTGNLTWIVTRGIEGTTAASHTDGLAVYVVLTATGVAQWIKDNFTKAQSTPLERKLGPRIGYPDDLNFMLERIEGDEREF